MDNLKKALGVILALIALAVVAHYAVGELYGGLLPQPGLVWDILNWFMAGGVLVALACQYRAKRALARGPGSRGVNGEYLTTNLLLFAAIVLTLWFFRNWFDNLIVGAGTQEDTILFIWQIVNPLFVLVTGATAAQLWRRPGNAPGNSHGNAPGDGSRDDSGANSTNDRGTASASATASGAEAATELDRQ